MELTDAKMLANALMKEHGLVNWSFRADKLITLSGPLTKVRTDEAVRNTILHEIAHALTPGAHHGPAWYQKALAIGCDGTRCSTDGAVAVKPAFVGTCPGCAGVIERHRRKNISCGRCSGGVFNEAFKFKWKRSK